jgi:uncharacterized protein YjbI with pentapeptide repeats
VEVTGFKIEPGADLTFATLIRINLSDANLTEALTKEDLSRANLMGADLTNA